MDINAVALGRVIVVMAVAGAWAGWYMARRRGLGAGSVAVIALLLGLLPPLNLAYLLFLRLRHPLRET